MEQRVLLVDDESSVTRSIKNLLRKEDYEILCAESGHEAVEIVDRNRIDVIVSDEKMAGMTGSMMLSQIHTSHPDIIKILLTGNTSKDTAVRCINDADIYRFLQKPCNGLDLVITIRRALEYRQLSLVSRELMRYHCIQTGLLENIMLRVPEIFNEEKCRVQIITEKLSDLTGKLLINKMENECARTHTFLALKKMEVNPDKDLQHDSAAVKSTARQNDAAAQTENASAGIIPACEASPQDIQELKPIMPRSEVQSLLDNGVDLKALSPTIAQLLQMTRNARTSIDSIVKVVRQDYAVSMKVLKLANSAVYTRGEPVDTIMKAVMRIGLEQIRQLIMNISVIDQFNSVYYDSCFDSFQFWEHSISTGLIAAELAEQIDIKASNINADVAFTMGLLHDIGRMVYLEILGPSYLNIIKLADSMQIPVERVESRMLLINHADAMDRILHKWGFSKEMTNAIALHQLSVGNIRRLCPRTLNEVTMLSLANRLSHALLLGSSGNLTIYPTDEHCDALRLRSNSLRQICEHVPPQTNDIKYSLLMHSEQQPWNNIREGLTESLDQSIRPIFISAKPEYDSIGIFCESLSRLALQDEPNFAVVHIKYGRDKIYLSNQLAEQEEAQGVAGLPLIIVSPKGDIVLDNTIMRDRKVKLLPFPFTVRRFIGELNSLLRYGQEEA